MKRLVALARGAALLLVGLVSEVAFAIATAAAPPLDEAIDG